MKTMLMIDFSIMVMLSALASAFFIMLAKKWGFVEYLQVHGSDLISKMANCDFCLSWWTNVLFAILLMVCLQDYHLIALPFFSTMITRYVL